MVVVVGYPEVTDAGNGGPWEWRPLGMAALNLPVSSSRTRVVASLAVTFEVTVYFVNGF